MAHFLVVYATSEGQTEKIAGYIAGRLRAKGAVAETVNANSAGTGMDLGGYACVIAGASIHVGQFQSEMNAFIRNYRARLTERRSGFFSVSGAASAESSRPDAERLTHDLLSRLDWQPDRVACFGGAIKYLHYGVIKRWFMQSIVARAGGDTDTSREREYTDWDAVDTFVDGLLHDVQHSY